MSTEEKSVSIEPQERLLPRTAWKSQVAYLRAVFRVKKALDRIEQEAGIHRDK